MFSEAIFIHNEKKNKEMLNCISLHLKEKINNTLPHKNFKERGSGINGCD